MKDNKLERYFGKAMRARRIEMNITQEKLSELVGISVTYLRNIEYGKHLITWKIWLELCKVLDLDPMDFMNKI